MLAELLAGTTIISTGTPLWVYVIGAGGSSAAVLFGAWALYARVRQERDKEVKERTENTAATRINTEAIDKLTRKMDDFIEATSSRFADNDRERNLHTREIEELRRRTER